MRQKASGTALLPMPTHLRPPENAAGVSHHKLAHGPLAAAAVLSDAPYAVSHVDMIHIPSNLVKKGGKGVNLIDLQQT